MDQEQRSTKEPAVGLPYFPEGYIDPNQIEGFLPWSYAEERLKRARAYWVGTVAAGGQPHITPIWGVWLDGALYFEGSPQTRRGRNIAANSKIVVHLDGNENGEDVLILQGEAHKVLKPERSLTGRLSAIFSEKYAYENYSPAPDAWDDGGLYRMKPHLAIGWTKFLRDPTRWIFEVE